MPNIENDDLRKLYWLYVLELEDAKYYVGVTSKTPEVRFKQHLNGFAGASWTREHKPLRIIDTKDLGQKTYNEAQEYENKVVRRYIDKYGLNNVRGGDLKTTEELLERFGRIYSKLGWESIAVVIFLLLIILILVIIH